MTGWGSSHRADLLLWLAKSEGEIRPEFMAISQLWCLIRPFFCFCFVMAQSSWLLLLLRLRCFSMPLNSCCVMRAVVETALRAVSVSFNTGLSLSTSGNDAASAFSKADEWSLKVSGVFPQMTSLNMGLLMGSNTDSSLRSISSEFSVKLWETISSVWKFCRLTRSEKCTLCCSDPRSLATERLQRRHLCLWSSMEERRTLHPDTGELWPDGLRGLSGIGRSTSSSGLGVESTSTWTSYGEVPIELLSLSLKKRDEIPFRIKPT